MSVGGSGTETRMYSTETRVKVAPPRDAATSIIYTSEIQINFWGSTADEVISRFNSSFFFEGVIFSPFLCRPHIRNPIYVQENYQR